MKLIEITENKSINEGLTSTLIQWFVGKGARFTDEQMKQIEKIHSKYNWNKMQIDKLEAEMNVERVPGNPYAKIKKHRAAVDRAKQDIIKIAKQAGAILKENFADSKGYTTDVPLGKYLYHVTHAEALEGMLKDGHLNVIGPEPFPYAEYFSMTADPKYSVIGSFDNDSFSPEVQIIIDTARVSKMETFEKHVEDWESTPGAGDWAKADEGDWESEYRVEEIIPLDYVVAVKILKSAITPEIIKLAKKRGVKLVGKDTNVLENFADGKKKGKSRPGRVKRAGASCKGSVTDLRARAKKYGGEKGRMYHWCANMKSGKR